MTKKNYLKTHQTYSVNLRDMAEPHPSSVKFNKYCHFLKIIFPLSYIVRPSSSNN